MREECVHCLHKDVLEVEVVRILFVAVAMDEFNGSPGGLYNIIDRFLNIPENCEKEVSTRTEALTSIKTSNFPQR